MWIKKAEFIKSSSIHTACPKPDKPEFAFMGRSNVGKSSFINRLSGINKLAKISSVPGKTALINHFLINDNCYLVDLPGYGFAKTSQTNRESWDRMIRAYLTNRKNLILVLLLIDMRIPSQEIDMKMMQWLQNFHIPFVVLFTKSDKLSNNLVSKNYMQILDSIKSFLLKDVLHIIVSGKTGRGVDETLKIIQEKIELFQT